MSKQNNVKIARDPFPQFMSGLFTASRAIGVDYTGVSYIPNIQPWMGDIEARGITLEVLEEEFATIWEAPHA